MTINTVGTLNLSILFGALFVFSAFIEFYRTIIPPTICTTHIFFINRILDPITSDVMNNVTYPRDKRAKYKKLNYNKNFDKV
jgi:uncharacterized membrane protein